VKEYSGTACSSPSALTTIDVSGTFAISKLNEVAEATKNLNNRFIPDSFRFDVRQTMN
jgi:hypothetical protein